MSTCRTASPCGKICACSGASTASPASRSASRRWPRTWRSNRSSIGPSGSLSAGQKTRVALAKALINDPELLLLDEPTASLDPDTADWVRGRLEAFRRERGATILLASHNMAEVERLCGRVLMLKQGQIVDDGSPDATDRPLRPQQSGGSVPRRRARAGRGGGAMTLSAAQKSRSRRRASARW